MGTRARKIRGFTLFEFAVCATLLGALVFVLLMRLSYYREEAERAAADKLVAVLRTALQLRAEEVRRTAGLRGLRLLAQENPFDWLKQKPANYLGEFYSPDVAELPRGNWVFDRRDKSLIFLLNSHKSFSLNASNLLRFKVEFVHMPDRGKTNGPGEVPKGVALVQVIGQPAVITDK